MATAAATSDTKVQFSIAGQWTANANISFIESAYVMWYVHASTRCMDDDDLYGWNIKWPIQVWNESQRTSLFTWTSWILCEWVCVCVFFNFFGGIDIGNACMFHWRSIKFVSNGKVPIWICCNVHSETKKVLFFFNAVSMAKEVETEENELANAQRAHSDKVKLIEMNRSSGYARSARHSLWMKFASFLFGWQRQNDWHFLFTHCKHTQTHTVDSHFDCLFVYSLVLCAENENWFFTLLAATRAKQKCKRKCLINFTRPKKLAHAVLASIERVKISIWFFWNERGRERTGGCEEERGWIREKKLISRADAVAATKEISFNSHTIAICHTSSVWRKKTARSMFLVHSRFQLRTEPEWQRTVSEQTTKKKKLKIWSMQLCTYHQIR